MKNDSGVFVIKLDIKLTMVDRKFSQAFSEILSSMTCYIFQATPKEMNDLDRVKGKVIP